MQRRVLTLLTALIITACSLADDAKKPGLNSNDDLPGPFRAYNVTGRWGERKVKEIGGKEREVEGQYHCPVCERGLNPVVMVVGRNIPMADPPEGINLLLKKLDAEVQKQRRARLGSFAVFLFDELKDVVTDDKERFDLSRQLKDKVDKAAGLNGGENVPLLLESKKYLDHYPFDENAKVIVVLYNQHKIAQTFNFPTEKLEEGDVDKVLAKLREMLPAAKK